MKDPLSTVWRLLTAVRKTAPLVHNITNFVVMETTANALLALGASPAMAHAEEEVEDIVSLASSLVLNIGTLTPYWVKCMHLALQRANALSVPVAIDPVGSGASTYRTGVALDLLRCSTGAILRGNAAEIVALTGQKIQSRGADSCLGVSEAKEAGKELAVQYGCVVCISGAEDFITDGENNATVTGGSELMTRVTGMGCTTTAFCGAFAAVAHGEKGNNNDTRFDAALAAMAVMSAAGALAACEALGPGSFAPAFLDRVFALSEEDIRKFVKIQSVI